MEHHEFGAAHAILVVMVVGIVLLKISDFWKGRKNGNR